MVPIEEYQVIVCGAGPVGLFLAITLKSQGISVAIVERQRAPYPLPRAVVFDHESRRLLSAVIPKALLEEIMEEVVGKGGQDGSNFVWRDANLKLVADLHWEKPTASGTPFAMGFNQPTLERLLLQHAVEKGIPIHRGFEIYALREGDDTVTLDCSDFAGPGFENNPNPVLAKSFRASYIVGCDGANSTIRKLLAIKSVDLGFENDWLIVDMLPKNGYIPPKVERVGSSQICDPNRPTTLVFGGKGRKRLEFMRLPHETKGDLLRDEKIWELVGAWGFNEDNCAVERRAMYTFNARWATEFWKGRIILAGDALHLMPPFIGQGLNSGFRDAGALAWRLPMLLQGEWSSAALLKSYQTERLEHVRKLTEHCIALGEIVCELDPGKSAKMHDFIRANPGGYDPALGQPGILTTQKEAGHLSWQRPLKAAGSIKATLLDEIYGSCWKLLSLAGTSPPIADQLQPSMKDFFNNLDGKIIEITEAQDVTGDYQTWFTEHIGAEHVVIVRPDFYVFGHAHVREVNTLLESLRAALIA